MGKNCGGGGGVKVTYIETQFVTSDAAGFKDLVQRLTGRSPPAPAAPHRPRPTRGAAGGSSGAATGQQGCYHYASSAARPAGDGRSPPCLEQLHEMPDFSDLFCVGASEHRRGPHNGGGYNDFPY